MMVNTEEQRRIVLEEHTSVLTLVILDQGEIEFNLEGMPPPFEVEIRMTY
jgi:hypothetical protein